MLLDDFTALCTHVYTPNKILFAVSRITTLLCCQARHVFPIVVYYHETRIRIAIKYDRHAKQTVVPILIFQPFLLLITSASLLSIQPKSTPFLVSK
ncbi:hypothetical protein HD806DRAFT_211668 [Xylariaceae sp. AK1471]|nr:hypothetical protein HD806DRAFT_211668 [Xylariaceae sp. AK1471]